MYRIHEIKLGLEEDKSGIPEKIKKRLGTKSVISEYKIVKESLDARDKNSIKYVYTVDFNIGGRFPGLEKSPDTAYIYPRPKAKPVRRPIIAGFGPCGMFAALALSEMGYGPIVLERGRRVGERVRDVELFWREGILDVESNVHFGEGGAGTFSDGKLTTGIKDPRVKKVLEELALAGAGDEILYKQRPHIGSDVLRTVVMNIREKIIRSGGEIRFETRLDHIITEQGRIAAVVAQGNGAAETIETDALILAVGHSARDTVRTLYTDGVRMEQKQFSIGVRIEHLQEKINESQYGKGAPKGLPPAEYKLAHRCANGRGVYTFCMCPGGEVIAVSSQAGHVATNGMSLRARDGKFANSAILVDVKTSDFGSPDPLSGIAFLEQYEQAAFRLAGGRYRAPKTTWGEFSAGADTAHLVLGSLPTFAANGVKEAMPFFAEKIAGFDDSGAAVYAVESRSSSPFRIARGPDYQSSVLGLYPGGEGAGYAGGIMSAAVDGIKIAEEIAGNFER